MSVCFSECMAAGTCALARRGGCVGELGANSHTAAAADGRRVELAVTYVSLLWTTSGEIDVGVSVSVEKDS